MLSPEYKFTGHPDQNSLIHNGDSFLVTSIQRWKDEKKDEFPIIHLLSDYGLQSPENTFVKII